MKLLRFLLPPLLLLTVFTACGSDDAAAELAAFQKITATEQTFTLDDFKAINFKKSKEYDVEGLTGATEVWFGFWKTADSIAKEYEARFYASHADAIEHGTFFADEVTGEDAVLEPEDATWKEGIKDRRAYFAAPLAHGSGTVQAK